MRRFRSSPDGSCPSVGPVAVRGTGSPLAPITGRGTSTGPIASTRATRQIRNSLFLSDARFNMEIAARGTTIWCLASRGRVRACGYPRYTIFTTGRHGTAASSAANGSPSSAGTSKSRAVDAVVPPRLVRAPRSAPAPHRRTQPARHRKRGWRYTGMATIRDKMGHWHREPLTQTRLQGRVPYPVASRACSSGPGCSGRDPACTCRTG